MLSGRAFRAQLVLQGQRALYDYWLKRAGEKAMPARSDLDPTQLTTVLPHLGLIDVTHGVGEAWFRLAGTKLRDIYGREITGKRTDQVFSGESGAYWSRVMAMVINCAAPVAGVVCGPTADRDHIVLFWLRLPLSEDGRKVDRILCHDMAACSDGPRKLIQQQTLICSAIRPRVAA